MIPRVSVVMAVYNGLPHLRMAIHTIRGQAFPDVEFVIVNDGSTDGSRDLLRAWADDDSRVRLIDQDNTGLTRALIRGVAETRGEFIARHDADDQSRPWRLEMQVAALDADPQSVAVTSALDIMRGDRSVASYMPKGNPNTFPWQLTFHNVLAGHGQFMFRKSAYLTAGGYDPAFQCAQDYDLWNRLKRIGTILICPQALYRHRIGDSGAISNRFAGLQNELAITIVQRELSLLAGRPVTRSDATEARKFWHEEPPGSLEGAALDRVDRLMRLTLRNYLHGHPEAAEARRVICQLVSRVWLLRARRQWRDHPTLAADAAIRAASWRPAAVVEEPRRIVRDWWARLERLDA